MNRSNAGVALAGAVAIGLAAAATAQAQDRGMILALSCAACHGTAGNSPGSIPSIRGKKATYIDGKLKGFRDGREAATVMDRIAKGYSDEEIAAMARYFASLE
jgi:sulfide dehydrogenase cytochrome subunit